ncbi:MAG: hypothetical protein ACNA8W_26185, partial [Bradymonadaceae bacterium]
MNHKLPGFAPGAFVLALSLGMLSCGPPERPWDSVSPDGQAQVSFLNKTHEIQILLVRSIRDELVFDCHEVARNPGAMLTSAHFGNSTREEVFSGQEMPFDPFYYTDSHFHDPWGPPQRTDQSCHIHLVELDNAPNIYVMWTDQLPFKPIYEDVDLAREIPADPQTIVLEADYSRVNPTEMNPWRGRPCGDFRYGLTYCDDGTVDRNTTKPPGARYEWHTEHDAPLHFEVLEPTAPGPQCELFSPGLRKIEWDEIVPSLGNWRVTELIDDGADCWTVMLASEHGPSDSFQACVPAGVFDPLNPELADQVWVEFRIDEELHVIPNRRYKSVSLEVRHLDEESTLFRSGSITLVRGHRMPQRLGLNWEAIPRTGCSPQTEVCSNRAVPVDVTLRTSSQIFPVASGEFVEL